MRKFVLLAFLIFSFIIPCFVKAQTWEFGAALGGAGYLGDLNASNLLKVSGPSFELFAKRNFDDYWAIRANYTYGVISAADSNSSNAQLRQRNLSFTTTLNEFSLTGEFNFMKYVPSLTTNRYTPYIFFGVALLNYLPTTVYQGQKYDLRPLNTEGQKKSYPTTAFSFPYGAGIKYNISGRLTVGAEIGYRNPNSDYLDDVSRNYANLINATPIAKALGDRSGEKTGVYIGTPGTQRGDLNPRDTYFFTHITLSYTFISQKCYFHN